MIWKYLIALFCLIAAINSTAQSRKESFGSRLVYGGGFGLQFGDITLIEVAPTVGYKLTDDWIAGIGFRYMYLKDNLFDYETNIYGGNIYTQYFFLENFLLHSEVEVLNLETYNAQLDGLERRNVTGVLAGGGVRAQVGGNAYFILLALWNLNASIYSPYRNPVIRAGVVVGI